MGKNYQSPTDSLPRCRPCCCVPMMTGKREEAFELEHVDGFLEGQ